MLERHVWRDFVAVTFSVAIVGIGLGCTLPLTALALIRQGFGPEVVGWLAAASALGGVTGTFAAPAITRRLGRRTVMLSCMLLATAAVMPLQFTSSLASWALLRFLFGLSMAPLFVLGEAWINLLPPDASRGRVVAIYSTSFSLCQMLGPGLTTWLSGLPDTGFLIAGALFLLGAPGVALARGGTDDDHASEIAPADATQNANASWWAIMRFAPVIIAGTAFFALFDTVTLSFLPLFALDYGFSREQALLAAAVVMAGDAMLQFAVGWLADHWGRARIHRLCGLLLCLLLPLMPWVVHASWLWWPYLFVLGGLAGAVYTLAVVASGDYFTGAALLRSAGLIALTWNVSSSAGPAITGMAMQAWGSAAMVAVLLVVAVGFLLVARVRPNGKLVIADAVKEQI
ncbi:MFS transporter [Silvimonas soli]|uniref:MFS transporter n=1 Tax=Silvimonas soli TaxID=2980100 RepID=UPI0024B3672E|nr:MFS transporter [Silvimonas soli]